MEIRKFFRLFPVPGVGKIGNLKVTTLSGDPVGTKTH